LPQGRREEFERSRTGQMGPGIKRALSLQLIFETGKRDEIQTKIESPFNFRKERRLTLRNLEVVATPYS
jgi:hypothetical protein